MIMDPFDLGRDWGPSALNVANQLSISLGYRLPFGHGQAMFSGAQGIGQQLIGGWQVNSIITALSGFPFTRRTVRTVRAMAIPEIPTGRT